MKYKGQNYTIYRESICKNQMKLLKENKESCFVPFTGNGYPICRLYETGNCKHGEIKCQN